MTPMHRFFNWVSSRYIIGRWRSTSSVAPSIPSSDSYSHEKPSSVTSSVCFSTSTTTKQVHFADDCGEALESIYVIPIKDTQQRTFHESLEEAYIDGTGIVTGILSVKHLEPGRNILVRYTENEWKSYNQTKARRFEKKEYNNILRRFKNIKGSHSDTDDSRDATKDEVVKFAFSFKVAKKKLIDVELVIISTLDGAIDQRHQQGYKLSKSFKTNMTYGRSINCWS